MMSRTPKLAAVAVLAAFSGLALQVHAQETVELDEVKVTAGRVEQELMDVNMSVSVITQEEIRHSKARNIGELLENVAGVRIMNDGSQGMKRVQIRGEDAFRTVVMIDGQRISEHKSMSGAPMLIDPSMVERIEVIKGPASVLYGSDAIGGAINIITKKGGKEKFGAEVSTGFNSSAQGKSAAASIYGTLDKLEYRLSAALEDNEELKTPVGEVPYTNFSSKTASLYLAYNLTEDTKIGLTADTYELDFMSGVQDASYEDFFVDVPKWKRTKGAVFVESKNLTDNLVRLRADAFYQQNKKDMHNRVYIYQKPSPIMPFPVVDMKMDNFAENELRQTGVSLQTDWMIGERHYLIAGYEFLYDDMTTAKSMYHTRSFSILDVGPEGMPYEWRTVANDSTGYQQMHALYLAMDSSVTDTITLNYGVRYTWVNSEVTSAEGSSTATGQYPNLPNQPDTPKLGDSTTRDSNDSRPVFNFGVNWRASDALSLRASWAQGFRVPNLMERYIPTSMGGGQVRANPDLDPETSDNFEVGLRWLTNKAKLDLAAFYSKADDYIAEFEVEDDIYQNKNVSGATTYGLELSASYRFDNGIEPYVIATFMRRKFEQDGMSTYNSGTPEFFGRYGVKWNGMLAGLTLRADAYAVSQSDTSEFDFDSRATTAYGGSTHYNLTMGVDFGPKRAYALDVGLYNITDKTYKTSDAIYEPGRFVMVKGSARF